MDPTKGLVADAGRNRELDWLRAYAILLVLAEHAVLIHPIPTFWSGVVHRWYEGRTGVDLFFVISGVVISRSFMDRLDAARSRGAALACIVGFYARRLLRLWPAAAFWALAMVVASVALPGGGSFPPAAVCLRKFVAAVTYTANFDEIALPSRIGYFYSLATEMQFYLVYPLALLIVTTRRGRLALAGTIFLLGLVSCPGFPAHLQTRFAGIVAGVALFLVLRASPRASEPMRSARPHLSALFTLTVLACLATCSLPFAAQDAIPVHVAALISCLLVGAACTRRGYVSALGMPHVLDWLGSRSYSLYLCHIPLMLAGHSVFYSFALRDGVPTAAPNLPQMTIVVVSLGTTLMAAEATYRLLEEPFRSPKRALALWRALRARTKARRVPEWHGTLSTP